MPLRVAVFFNDKLIAEGRITQVGRHEGDLRDYRVQWHTEQVSLEDTRLERKQGKVRRYDRKTRPVWDLVCLALKSVGYGKE